MQQPARGTALTAQQLATLDAIAPLADRAVISGYDNDTAGRAAAVKAFRLLECLRLRSSARRSSRAGSAS